MAQFVSLEWRSLQSLDRGFYKACGEWVCLCVGVCVFLLLIQSPETSVSGWWSSLADMLDGIGGEAFYNPLLIWWPVKELPLETQDACVCLCVCYCEC